MGSNTVNTDPAEIRLDDFAASAVMKKSINFGYPLNQKSKLVGFYRWLWGSGINLSTLDNVGDPFDIETKLINTLEFEREVIEYFGMDDTAGIFLTTKDILNNQNPFDVSYLAKDMPMINCSRSAMSPLKLWWIITHKSKEEFAEQTAEILERAEWLKGELEKAGWPVWLEKASNTVYFKRPPEAIVEKYGLAPDYDERLGGELSHIVVMQHVTKERLAGFLDDLNKTST